MNLQSAEFQAALASLSVNRLLDQVGDSVLITDSAGVILFVNPAFEALTGYTAAEVIGRTPALLNSGHHPAEVFEELWQTLREGKSFRFILVNKKKDGSLYQQGTNISPIRNDAGETTHYFSMGRIVQEARQTYEAFVTLANVSPVGAYVIQDGKYFFVNEHFTQVTGYSADELIGQPWHTIQIEEDRESTRDLAFAMLRDQPQAAYEYRIRAKDGSVHWVLETIKHAQFFGMRSLSGAFAIGNFVDITDRKQTEQELNRTLSMYAATMDSTADGILVASLDGKSVNFNRRYGEMWSANSGRGFENLLSQIKDPEAFEKRTFALMETPTAESIDSVELLDGRVYEIFSKPQLLDGVPVGRVWSHRDITERRQHEEQMVRLANHDSLTGLLNRRRLQEELAAGVQESAEVKGHCALLLLDIDRFKEINDALGHHAGDDLLVRLADVLNSTMSDHVVARFGGDEFAVFMRNTDRQAAEAAAAHLTVELRSQSSWDAGARLPLTVSIGVAVYPDLAGDVDELCSHADVAMYDAKTSGRNRVSVYSPRLQQRVLRFPRDWRDRITDALNQERLELYEQPIINPQDGVVSGHELLIRLLNEDGTAIPAKHFIPFAEQSGLIQGIDQWVTREAMRLAQRLQATGSREYLAFNLSRWAFVDPEMLELVKHEIAATGVDPHLIVVEMTETSALADIGSAERFMSGLRSSGCRFALDDFGVGYSSFHHLKRLPVDFLKIDGSFVREITHNRADREIVSAMVKMAQGLGLHAIAEAVHSEAVMNAIREIGVPFAQGYWIARPRPASRLFSQEDNRSFHETRQIRAA